jgi:hypothetical protein
MAGSFERVMNLWVPEKLFDQLGYYQILRKELVKLLDT